MNSAELENVSCNLCNAKDSPPLYKGKPRQTYSKEMFYPTSASFHTENIVKCRNCGLVFTNPRLRTDILLNFYAEGKDEKYIEQAPERSKAFKKAIRFVERLHPPGRMLDIGCGAGFLLYEAKKSDWTTAGLEINSFFSDFAKTKLNIDVVNKPIEQADFEPASFDVIMIQDTLEHVPDPYFVLSKSYNWLKNGGFVFINTPDINSACAKLLKSKWWFLETMHMYYFSPQTLKAYFDKTGFIFIKKSRYAQTLKLGYLVSKVIRQDGILYKIIENILKYTGLGRLNITYYAGQMTVVGKKPA